jgi:hypothetical protein
VILRVNQVGTALFVATATLAAVVFSGPAKVVGVIVALALFAIGVWTFLWSYWSAVQRSRVDQIAVTQLYFLVGEVVDRRVKRWMMGLLTLQCVVALATALARPSTEGAAGSTLAFGILVPMFGLGLNGLLAAHHGTFEPRRAGDVPPLDPEMDKNANHG